MKSASWLSKVAMTRLLMGPSWPEGVRRSVR